MCPLTTPQIQERLLAKVAAAAHRDLVLPLLETGELGFHRLHWRRVGFNSTLYERLLAFVPDPEPEEFDTEAHADEEASQEGGESAREADEASQEVGEAAHEADTAAKEGSRSPDSDSVNRESSW